MAYPLLNTINTPKDFKNFSEQQLVILCEELRQFIIDTVSENGGHFAANLGTVELTVALHFVFDTPNDKLIWDVGHQAYGHKIITGRKHLFSKNRKLDGLSGFPKIEESEYDAFGTGHSSTSISAALGMAVASSLNNSNRHHIAVIGDGALTAGQAFEGLNNAISNNANILILINDNHIGIDPNGGSLKEHLENLDYTNENLFTHLGFQYFGPINGHNIQQLVASLKQLQNIKGAKVLHIKTTKGKGYLPAEQEQTRWHSTGKFDKISGKGLQVEKTEKYQDVFGEVLCEIAQKNSSVVAVSPAMISGSSLHLMQAKFPNRVFDVGIAEQHAVTFSAGLAVAGMTPICAIYSTFLQRGYDQLIHDVCLQKLPVIFCIDRAGIVGEDGPTHHGVFDLAYLRPIPHLVIAAPMSKQELQKLMHFASEYKEGPFAIRYPRGKAAVEKDEMPETIQIGKGRILKPGEKIAVLSIGHIGNMVANALKDTNCTHVDMRFVKPLDTALLHQIATSHQQIITIEDGCIAGGFGSAVSEFILENELHCRLKIMGWPDNFIPQGKPEELYEKYGLDEKGLLETILR